MIRVLNRHRVIAFLFFAATLCLTILAVVFYPRKYQSEAKLLVRIGHETATLDPTATTGQVVTIQKSHERDIKTVLEILRSQTIAEQVVDAIGVEVILGQSKPGVLSKIRGILRFVELDPITDREKAIRLVRKRIDISAAGDADVVTIAAKNSTPQSARELLQQYLDSFFVLQTRLGRTEGGQEFFENQTELVHRQLDHAFVELRDAKNEFGLLTVEGRRAIVNGQLASVSEQIGQLEGALVYSEAKVRELNQSIETLPATVMTELVSGIGNDASDRMRSQLYDLEMREKQLASQYHGDHPVLRAVREQRKLVDEIYKNQPNERTQQTNSINAIRQQIRLELLTESATIAAYQSKSQELVAQKAKLREELVALNGQEMKIAELEGKVRQLASAYNAYAERQEQARIDQALEADQISSINVVQPPTISDRPTTPNAAAWLVLGGAFAMIGSVFVVIIANYFDNSFATTEQVERQLALPVLVSIPHLPVPQQRHRNGTPDVLAEATA